MMLEGRREGPQVYVQSFSWRHSFEILRVATLTDPMVKAQGVIFLLCNKPVRQCHTTKY